MLTNALPVRVAMALLANTISTPNIVWWTKLSFEARSVMNLLNRPVVWCARFGGGQTVKYAILWSIYLKLFKTKYWHHKTTGMLLSSTGRFGRLIVEHASGKNFKCQNWEIIPLKFSISAGHRHFIVIYFTQFVLQDETRFRQFITYGHINPMWWNWLFPPPDNLAWKSQNMDNLPSFLNAETFPTPISGHYRPRTFSPQKVKTFSPSFLNATTFFPRTIPSISRTNSPPHAKTCFPHVPKLEFSCWK